MITLRTLRSDFDPSRSEEYAAFERESLDMWKRQPGFDRVDFTRSGPNRAVTLSFWENRRAAEAVPESSTYKETIKKLADTGMLTAPQTDELLEMSGGAPPTTRPSMVARVWRSEFDPSRSKELERLETESLLMWNRQPGYEAVLFSRSEPNTAVTMSFWVDRKSADALAESIDYIRSMKKLEGSGILSGPQTDEFLEMRGGLWKPSPGTGTSWKVTNVPYFNPEWPGS